MSYYSRLACEILERENFYADDDCSPSWEAVEEPASAPYAQGDEMPLAA